MIKDLHSAYQSFQRKFKLYWSSLSLMLLLSLTYLQWHQVNYKLLNEFQLNASKLSLKVEELLARELNELKTLAMLDQNLKLDSCKAILPKLQTIIFNSPYASGFFVKNTITGKICSTLKEPPLELESLNLQEETARLYGPLNLNSQLSHVFLLANKTEDYILGVYIIEDMFENIFKNTSFDFVGLYDNQQRRLLYHKGKLFALNEPINAKPFSSYFEKKQGLITQATLPLEDLNNISLIIRDHDTRYIYRLIIKFFSQTLPLCLLSILAYFYFNKLIKKQFSLEYALSNALAANEFYPVYQPIYDTLQQSYSGAEVLIRWNTHYNENIMPDYFIDIAEESGLIIPMTLSLIEKAFSQCQHLFHSVKEFHLSFNLSLQHFRDENFFNQFYQLCKKYAISPRQIMLELTERALYSQEERFIVKKMEELRAKGYDLAIDDFGTGQSNLHYLHHFPFNFLKIDKLFIHSIGTGALVEKLNTSIITLAKTLEMQIIAEGVETEEQRDYLIKHHVNYLQGWLYAKPMRNESFIQFMQKKLLINPKIAEI